jgi:hypothetical protein
MFIPDPGSWFLPIPDPGSRISDPGSINSNKREGWKKICCHNFLCSHKVHKIAHYFSFDVLKKKIWANFQRIIELFTKKMVNKLSKLWIWYPGSEIRDPGSEIRDSEKTYSGSRVPDPGVKKAPIPDPGSGSATLAICTVPIWFSPSLKKKLKSLLRICVLIPYVSADNCTIWSQIRSQHTPFIYFFEYEKKKIFSTFDISLYR